MKAKEVPEKIYCDSDGNGNMVRVHNIKWPDGEAENIEYTRTDAFIEKACKFLSNKANIPLWEGYAYTFGCDTTKLVDDFVNYMKGE